MSDDEISWMKMALDEAKKALTHDDVPVGAIVARSDGTVISRAHNERELRQDPTAHAEILVLQHAAEVVGSWRLSDCTLVVTLEPCTMCAGAAVLSRIPRLVYGATDPKAGAVSSLYQICEDHRLNHQVDVTRGVLETECGQLLRSFFIARRDNRVAPKPQQP